MQQFFVPNYDKHVVERWVDCDDNSITDIAAFFNLSAKLIACK